MTMTEPTPGAGAVPPATTDPGAARGRWTIALIVVGVAIAVLVFALAVLAGLGGGSSSVVARWVPADTTAYAELRLDLPGDQEANLASFLSAFPGFDDAARLEDKLAEIADRLIGEGTDGELDYSTQIEPWFGGQMAAAHGPGDAVGNRGGAGLVVVSVTDEATAGQFLDRVIGRPTATEDYQGVTITTVEGGPRQTAWALNGGVLLVGDIDEVKAAIDTGGASAFATSSDLSTARRELGGDQLAFWFVDTAAIRERIGSGLPDLPVPLPSVEASILPDWASGGLRFETDSAVATTIVPHVEAIDATNAESAIPGRVPATTVALVDVHDVGPRLQEFLGSLGETDGQGQLGGALRLLGGAEGLVGWVSEAGVVALGTAGEPSIGVVATSNDAAASQSLFTQLQVAARLAGGEVATEDADGVPIVTVTLTGLDRLLGGGGLQAFGQPVPLGGTVSLSWATSGDLVVIGTDAAFVRSILATTSDTSLASSQPFAGMLDTAGRSHAALGWVDAAGALELATASGLELGEGEAVAEIREYLAPLDGALGTFVVGGSVDRSTVILSVTEPS
jgi:hypothetical protein